MRAWLVGIGIAAALAPAAGAGADARTSPFAPVPRSRSAYTAIYTAITRLEERGYFGSTGNYSGEREFTRYEFAVAVERLSTTLRSRVLSAADPTGLRQDLWDYSRLLNEFQKEIAGLGPDVSELKRQLQILEQRIDRLEAAPSPGPDLSGKLAQPKSYGVRSAFRSQQVQTLLDSVPAAVLPNPLTRSFTPQARASAGDFALSFRVDEASRLDTVADLPLEDPADSRSFRARLDLPLGGFTLSAFYLRDGTFTDRYRLVNPYGLSGRTEGVGGGVTGALIDNVNFLVDAASIRSLDDDLARALSFRAGLNYEISRGMRLGAAFERTRQFGMPGITTDLATYTLFLERNWGKNTTFSLIYRYFNPLNAAGAGAARDGDSSALIQTSVKF